jgi:hypothetical protein
MLHYGDELVRNFMADQIGSYKHFIDTLKYVTFLKLEFILTRNSKNSFNLLRKKFTVKIYLLHSHVIDIFAYPAHILRHDSKNTYL